MPAGSAAAQSTYRPADGVRRDQVALFVMRGYDYVVAEDDVDDDVPLPPDPGSVGGTVGGEGAALEAATVAGDGLSATSGPMVAISSRT